MQQGIQATSYTCAGCEIPHIREKIPYIVPKTNNPTHVILQCGGNDAERRPAERVIAQYESLIQAVRRACPNAYISVSRIPPRRNNNTILNKIGQINAHLEQKCSGDQGLSFVDACPDSIYLYKRDLVHFNGRGIKFYADKLKEHIQGFRARGVTRPMWLIRLNVHTCLRARRGAMALRQLPTYHAIKTLKPLMTKCWLMIFSPGSS